MSTSITQPPKEDLKTPEAEPARSGPGAHRKTAVLWAALAVLGVYAVWGIQSTRSQMASRLGEVDQKVAALETGATSLETRLAETRSRLESTGERLGATREELERARSLARKNRDEQQRSAERLGGALEAQKTDLVSLSGTVGDVRTDVTASRQDLDRAIGDLGEHSGLIARNREELAQLKRRGEREYFEFDLRKSKEFTRVGPLALRLNKTDAGKQRYTLTVLLDDKRVEKKDKTLLEPVQFYVRGSRSVLEVVAQDVGDGRVVGYVSAPIEKVPLS
jgi:septal ring factor EnvC (AmiA/AmiB activator)